MARSVRRALCEVMEVEVGLLRHGPPLAVKEDERSKAVGIGVVEDPRVNGKSAGRRDRATTTKPATLELHSLLDDLVRQLVKRGDSRRHLVDAGARCAVRRGGSHGGPLHAMGHEHARRGRWTFLGVGAVLAMDELKTAQGERLGRCGSRFVVLRVVSKVVRQIVRGGETNKASAWTFWRL